MFETLNKMIEGKKSLEAKALEPRNDKWLNDSLALFTMQYRGNPSQLLAAKVRQISWVRKIFKKKLAISQNLLCS